MPPLPNGPAHRTPPATTRHSRQRRSRGSRQPGPASFRFVAFLKHSECAVRCQGNAGPFDAFQQFVVGNLVHVVEYEIEPVRREIDTHFRVPNETFGAGLDCRSRFRRDALPHGPAFRLGQTLRTLAVDNRPGIPRRPHRNDMAPPYARPGNGRAVNRGCEHTEGNPVPYAGRRRRLLRGGLWRRTAPPPQAASARHADNATAVAAVFDASISMFPYGTGRRRSESDSSERPNCAPVIGGNGAESQRRRFPRPIVRRQAKPSLEHGRAEIEFSRVAFGKFGGIVAVARTGCGNGHNQQGAKKGCGRRRVVGTPVTRSASAPSRRGGSAVHRYPWRRLP